MRHLLLQVIKKLLEGYGKLGIEYTTLGMLKMQIRGLTQQKAPIRRAWLGSVMCQNANPEQ
jgi:hypothetical protein